MMMSDLPQELVGEKILTRVPITSLKAVRSTCKTWDAITKSWVVLERFGPRLPLPFDSFDGFNDDLVTLSSFLGGDDEQLAVLFGGYESGFFEIWVTLTVEPNRASWSKFLRMEPGPFSSYGFKLYSSLSGGSFFVTLVF
ncbi:hypothetical protein F2Q68_00046245 [Brassica cretica]|uniref:F-box associated beta-propeller type 1 domain-containing protein n=1 Tax=Brassica cretica TaxID=69181 RepID=A0A8S9LGQ0_BRACR|nr:hypothetical protein F2Q68_00046245 [Brassica cretica]